MRKRGVPEVLVISVKSLYVGAKTRVRVDSELSDKCEVKVRMHEGSLPSPFLFAVVVDIVTELAREGALSELLYADDLVLMREMIEVFRNKYLKWKEDFECKSLIVCHEKTKVMVSGSVVKNGLCERKVYQCGVCGLKVKANSAVCAQ